MKYAERLTTDLRELVEQHLGKPLAVSTNAGLWRCPACPPERHALLMVSADKHHCLGRYACDGGASEWMHDTDKSASEPLALGETA